MAAPARNAGRIAGQRRGGAAEDVAIRRAHRDARRRPLRRRLARAVPSPSAPSWERYVLAPDVELHVRRPLTRSQNRAVARLLEAARQLLEEDQP